MGRLVALENKTFEYVAGIQLAGVIQRREPQLAAEVFFLRAEIRPLGNHMVEFHACIALRVVEFRRDKLQRISSVGLDVRKHNVLVARRFQITRERGIARLIGRRRQLLALQADVAIIQVGIDPAVLQDGHIRIVDIHIDKLQAAAGDEQILHSGIRLHLFRRKRGHRQRCGNLVPLRLDDDRLHAYRIP